MDNFYKYNRTIILFFVTCLLILILLSIYMEPLEGGLTRIGGFLENDYGWQEPQDYFEKPLYTKSGKIEGYNKYYDVLVIGDSFSQNMKYGWQNYFVNETGLSLMTFHLRDISVTDVLNSEIYKSNPPKLVIYESVERLLWNRLDACKHNTNEVVTNNEFNSDGMKSLNIKPIKKYRNKSISIWDIDLDVAANYLMKATLRNIFNINYTKSKLIALKKSDLFSNKVSNNMLVYSDDFEKVRLTIKDINTISCSILEIKNSVQLNKTTSFIAMVPPDKLSAYTDYIRDRNFTDISIIPKIAKIEGLNLVRLDLKLKNTIKDGVSDVYLPNDTHWSSFGYKTVAMELIKFLQVMD